MQDKNSKFTIGEFTFETFHEYRDAQEDVKKIQCIEQQLDVQDPEVAVRLYNNIRSGKIVFKSPIGDQFFAHIADIVADKSVDLLEDKAVVEEAESQVKYQKILGIVCIGLAIACALYFGIVELQDIMATRKLQKLQEQTNTQSQDEQPAQESTQPLPEDTVIDPSTLTILPEYQELKNENQDLVGWLSIDDTQINYPVVQKENDNEYYLNHSFDGAGDNNGTLFVDYRSDIVNPTSNTIIYGHNMKSGMMFGTLKNYLDETFYQTHKTINFHTIYEKRTYQVVAVGLSKVGYRDDNSYKYYDFIDAGNEAEFSAFLENIKSLSVFGTDLDVTYEDKLLTLSTCNSYTEDGRLFVVAKRIN